MSSGNQAMALNTAIHDHVNTRPINSYTWLPWPGRAVGQGEESGGLRPTHGAHYIIRFFYSFMTSTLYYFVAHSSQSHIHSRNHRMSKSKSDRRSQTRNSHGESIELKPCKLFHNLSANIFARENQMHKTVLLPVWAIRQ